MRATLRPFCISLAQQPHCAGFTSENPPLFAEGNSISSQQGGRHRGERRAWYKLHQETTEEEEANCKQRLLQKKLA